MACFERARCRDLVYLSEVEANGTSRYFTEGILCAIETAHAVHGAVELARELDPEQVVLVCLSGRGDKDMDTAARWFDLLDPGAAE